MFISRKRQFIFVHIPKTGGTALSLALEDRAMKDDIIIGDTPKAQARKKRLKGIATAGPLTKHATLADIAGLLTDDEIAGFFTFTLVRNPWDQMVSYYHWLKAQKFAHFAVDYAQKFDFHTFLQQGKIQATLSSSYARSYMTDRFGNERANAYVRLEQMDRDFALVEAHLGFPLTGFMRANSSNRQRDWRPYYNDETRAIITALCAEDIARFGYGFNDCEDNG